MTAAIQPATGMIEDSLDAAEIGSWARSVARELTVLHVIPSLDPATGGPAEGLRHYCLQVSGTANRFEVLTLDDPGAPWLKNFPAKVYALGPARWGYYYAPHVVPWLRARAADYDAVVVHGMWQFPGYATRQALRRGGTPYFVFPHGMLDPSFRRDYPLKHLKKWLYWVAAEYRVIRDARGVLFTSKEESLQAPDSFALYRARHAFVGYGVADPDTRPDVDREAFLTAFPALRNKRLVLFLSRIHPKKGCDLLITAFAAVTRESALHLVIAGPDSAGSKPALVALSERLGVADRVTWTGMLTGPLKWGAFHAADVFVLPSHHENFGIAVVEALACGVPVLISDKINICREIEAAGAGLVGADDLPGTLRLLESWLALSPAHTAAMREQARPVFLDRFHASAAAERLLDVLDALTQASFKD